jgi:DNA-binding transcriptional MerR regulator
MKVGLQEKLYYNIGEVAEAFEVNTSLIRFWEKEFDIIKPKKNKKGNRKFTPQDIEHFELIYHLVKERGFTLDGAKQHLKEHKSETLSKFEMIRKLKKIKSELQALKSNL